MNILFCERLKVGELGTYSIHIYEVVTNLSKLGHNVVLMNANYPRGETKVDVSRRSLWPRIKSAPILWRILQPVRGEILILWLLLREIYIFLSAFVIMARYKGKFDVIYRRNHVFNSEYLLAKLFKIPSVIEVNGIYSDEIKLLKFGDKLSVWVMDRLDRFCMRRTDKIIAVTPQLKEFLESEYGIKADRIIIIQNGADTDLFRPMDAIKVREELNLRQDCNYICFVGSLVQWQGIDHVIKSMPLVLSKCPQAQLIIVGDGQIKQDLINLAGQVGVSDKVIFTGMVPYQKVPLYINASDVCLMLKIGLKSGYSPLKLCEYMACEKPVVASRDSRLEILEESRGGIFVGPGNSVEVASAIIRLLQDKELRKQMGENGRRYVVENQSWGSVATRVAEVCQSLVDSTRQGDEQ